MKRFLLLLSLAFILTGGSTLRADDANLLLNPGFEDPKKAGWIDNNWAKLDAEYAFDDKVFHSGLYSKRMTLKTAVPGRELQEGQWPLDLKGGTAYRLKYWLKGSPGGSGKVTVLIRDAGAPYTTYASATVTPGEEWTEYTLEFKIPAEFEDKKVGLYLGLANATTIWLDDTSLTVVPPATN